VGRIDLLGLGLGAIVPITLNVDIVGRLEMLGATDCKVGSSEVVVA